MSREILFRGKTQDGEWIYGDLIHDKERFSSVRICIRTEYSTGTFYHGIAPRVITETVGQFTGLVDKNGKKIFEGDIVKDTEYDEVYLVKYFGNNNYPAFDVTPEMSYIECNGLSYLCNDCCIEIIGNIHDNPELLEGGGQ